MTPLEIFLIIIGAGVVILSLVLTDNSNKKDKMLISDSSNELTIGDIEETLMNTQTTLAQLSDTYVDNVKDKLSQLSNEKIIAVHDFSEQIIEKISQNHEEVLFLYNMLCEKEKELGDLLNQINKEKSYLLDRNNSVITTAVNKSEPSDYMIALNSDMDGDNAMFKPVMNNEEDLDSINHNNMILELYREGLSIKDIAKKLELGQGEVKLVIELYVKK